MTHVVVGNLVVFNLALESVKTVPEVSMLRFIFSQLDGMLDVLVLLDINTMTLCHQLIYIALHHLLDVFLEGFLGRSSV